MATTLTFADAGFPSSTFSGTVQDLVNAFVANLTATIPTTSVISGQIGGTAPVSDIGPWLDGRVWKSWAGSDYQPMLLEIGTSTHTILFAGTPTANRTQTFQDSTGIVALQSDVFSPRPSIDLSLTSPANQIDWSAAGSFYETITASNTFTMINSLPGQQIKISITSSIAGAVVFPSTILWVGGTNPTQTVTGTDVYELWNVAGTIYGRQLLNFS